MQLKQAKKWMYFVFSCQRQAADGNICILIILYDVQVYFTY